MSSEPRNDDREVVFTIQVWQLAVIVLGVLALAAKFFLGAPIPLHVSKVGLGIRAAELLVVVLVLGLVALRLRRSGADADDL